jgi:hypothetical protein
VPLLDELKFFVAICGIICGIYPKLVAKLEKYLAITDTKV